MDIGHSLLTCPLPRQPLRIHEILLGFTKVGLQSQGLLELGNCFVQLSLLG